MHDLYQLRVVLRNVSPLIWRRLLVQSDTSIAELHAVLQTAMGWSDTPIRTDSTAPGDAVGPAVDAEYASLEGPAPSL